MAAENFKVKKGLEVGTGITANSDGVDVTGIVTATQFVGDGSGLTGVVGSGSGIVVKDEGSAVGTAGTVNFVGSGVAATLSAGTATVTINAGGLDNVVEDTTPELGGDLNLNSKFITGSGGINVTGVVTATTIKGNGDFVDIDVDGQTEVDDLNIAGVTTATTIIATTGLEPDADNGAYLGTNAKSWSSLFVDNIGVDGNVIQALSGNLELNSASGSVVLQHGGNQKLTTTTNGIEVPDLNVTGVGTVGRLDTDGVVLGTNGTTFAAKFSDNAVANFGTDNDLKISHDDTHARITNTKGDIVVSGIISATSDVKVGSAITMDPTSGIITATSFSGSGSGLTSIPSAQLTGALPALDGSALTGVTASGSGVIVKHDGTTVGTAGTINFSTNLDVSAISAGIVTVTASGGSSQNVFSTIAVSGQSNVVADSTTDTLTFAAGSNITLTTNAGTDTVTIAAANDNTQLSSEQVQDIVGAMFSSNTETDITATYQDADGTIDLVVDLSSLNASNLDSGTIPNGRFPATLPATSGANLTALNASEITSGTLPIARIADDAVTFAKMQNVGTGVFIGRNDSGSGDIETLTAAEARTLLNVADGATAGITTAPSNMTASWNVIHNSASAYRFTGPGQDGAEDNPDIYLLRGHRYRFSLSSTSGSHPLQIRDTGGTTYTDGVTYSDTGNNRTTAGNDLDISVQHDAPAALKYHCTAHGAMVGNIYIVGQHLANGADNRVVTATSAYGINAEANMTFDGDDLTVSHSGLAVNIFESTDNHSRFRIKSGSSSLAQLEFADQDDADAGEIRYNHSTDKMTIHVGNNSERVGITSTGDVDISNGNLVVASGHGIDFSATSDGSGTDSSELLDDYEEGTWTPTVNNGFNSISYTIQRGWYVKIGNLLHASFFLRFSASGAGTHIRFAGIPYASANLTPAYSSGGNVIFTNLPGIDLSANIGQQSIFIGGNYSYFELYNNGNSSSSSGSSFSDKDIYGHLTYRTG